MKKIKGLFLLFIAFLFASLLPAVAHKSYSAENADNESQQVFSEGKEIFVKAGASPSRAYVNQQIIYSLKFYRKVPVKNASLERQVFEGFISEDMGTDKEYPVTVASDEYYVYEKNFVLFPTKAGEFKIPSTGITCDVLVRDEGNSGDFLNPFSSNLRGETHTFISNPVTVEVMEIPENGQPAGFNNMVGKYIIKAELSKNRINAGETTLLTITVSGKGNIKDVVLPLLPEITGVKVYEEQPVVTLFNSSSVYSGEKVFKKTLVSFKGGQIVIDPVRISFFDPEEGRYESAETKKIYAEIAGSLKAETENADTLQSQEGSHANAVRQIAFDILPIKTSLNSSMSYLIFPEIKKLMMLLIIPPVGYVFLLVWQRRRRRYREDIRFTRSAKALARAMRTLKDAEERLSKGAVMESCEITLRGVKGYFGDKFCVEGEALTGKELCEVLSGANIEEEKKDEVKEIIYDLEQMIFASNAVSEEKAKKIIGIARTSINDCEKLL